jgi:predicted DNA-binding transcriptional regulator AlpA
MAKRIENQSKERLLSSRAVAEILGLSCRTVHRLNSSALIIRPLRISGSVRYLESELMAWIQAGMPKRSEFEARKEAENE